MLSHLVVYLKVTKLCVNDFSEENIIQGAGGRKCGIAASRQPNIVSERLICAVVLDVFARGPVPVK